MYDGNYKAEVRSGGKALLIESVDFFRLDANRKLDPERRSALGQFMTPAATARLMASMFEAKHESIRLLDAGAGVGSLTAAFIEEMCGRSVKPRHIGVTAYEIDGGLTAYLADTLRQCQRACEGARIEFESDLIEGDFIDDGVRALRQEAYKLARHSPPPISLNEACREARFHDRSSARA